MIVVSTGINAPTKERCIESVTRQTGVAPVHVYIEAADQHPPWSATANLASVIRPRAPREIVVWLDGDDWLADDHALEHVASIYSTDPDVWLTYGSYVHADGRRGICAPYESTAYRVEPWKASHLRTFRAGLFQRIKPENLRFDLAVDQAVMLPMLEMAGAARVKFVPRVLAIYNYANSYEHRASAYELAAERRAARAIRALPTYPRLERL